MIYINVTPSHWYDQALKVDHLAKIGRLREITLKVEKGERGRKRHGLQTKRMMRRRSIRTMIVPIMLMISNIAIVFAVSLSLSFLLSLLHPPLLPSRLVPDNLTLWIFLTLLSLSLSLLFFLTVSCFFLTLSDWELSPLSLDALQLVIFVMQMV